MTKQISAYIVEDDLENIELLKHNIKKHCPQIKIVGEANNSEEFIDLLLLNEAEIIFLDIELGEQKTSLDILKDFFNIDPEIIILTSSKDYAINALNDYDISSYVLKPIDGKKLKKAVQKAAENKKEKTKLTAFINNENLADNFIALAGMEKIKIIDIHTIRYIEADGKYTTFHLDDDTSITVSKNIGSYYDILPKNIFFRIHHKFVINIGQTDSIYQTVGYYCVLKNKKILPIAKRRIENFRKFLFLK